MRARAEGPQARAVALDVERVGIGKDALVAVRRRQQQRDPLALAQRPSVEPHVRVERVGHALGDGVEAPVDQLGDARLGARAVPRRDFPRRPTLARGCRRSALQPGGEARRGPSAGGSTATTLESARTRDR